MIHDALSSNKLGISNPSQVGVDIKMTLPLLVAALCFNGAGIGGQQVREMLPNFLSEQIKKFLRLVPLRFNVLCCLFL